jgi:hypothetical protein
VENPNSHKVNLILLFSSTLPPIVVGKWKTLRGSIKVQEATTKGGDKHDNIDLDKQSTSTSSYGPTRTKKAKAASADII